MPLPKQISVQTLSALNSDPNVYETHRATIQGLNNLISALGPGATVTPASFTLSPGLGDGATVSLVSGTYLRGRCTVTVGASAITASPTIRLNFPKGTFNATPFAQVVKNGGTGALGITYSETIQGLTVTFSGTPTASTTYTLQWQMRE